MLANILVKYYITIINQNIFCKIANAGPSMSDRYASNSQICFLISNLDLLYILQGDHLYIGVLFWYQNSTAMFIWSGCKLQLYYKSAYERRKK